MGKKEKEIYQSKEEKEKRGDHFGDGKKENERENIEKREKKKAHCERKDQAPGMFFSFLLVHSFMA